MQSTELKPNQPAHWTTLLSSMLKTPGKMAECYQAFHQYSIGNQILAVFQLAARGIPTGPINTLRGWNAMGRHVKRGEKALVLCMPYHKVREDAQTGERVQYVSGFAYKPRWFALAQTTGPEPEPLPTPGFDLELALDVLKITRAPFDIPDGNCQGYATGRQISVNPVAEHPERTALHETAHVVLGHTEDGRSVQDGPVLSRNLQELEAEGVAYLLADAFGLPGAAESRAYVQHWFQGAQVPERNAQRIITAAGRILEAGKVSEPAMATSVA